MAGVNQVTLIGNLGADPESRSFNNGGMVVNLRVATTETWKDRDGNRQEKTEWHSVSIFSEGLGKVAEDYLRKGSKVFLQGKLETRKWQDQDGKDRYSTEVVLRGFDAKLVMLDGANDSGSGGRGRDRDDGWGDSGGRGGGRGNDRGDRGGRSGGGRSGGYGGNRGTRNDRDNDRGGDRDGGWGNRGGGGRDDRGGSGQSRDSGQGSFGGGYGDDLDDDVPF